MFSDAELAEETKILYFSVFSRFSEASVFQNLIATSDEFILSIR
jgi:hypothetical protein